MRGRGGGCAGDNPAHHLQVLETAGKSDELGLEPEAHLVQVELQRPGILYSSIFKWRYSHRRSKKLNSRKYIIIPENLIVTVFLRGVVKIKPESVYY